jgi:uncharacterized protein YdaU (DUF1376 family)
MNYYPHHIGDFNNATRHLTRVERSIYRDLIDLYYDTEQPLSLDVQWLARKILARSAEESAAVQQVLSEFFDETASGWYHDRCEVEIAEYRKTISSKSAAGKASAAKREAERLERLANLNGVPTTDEHVLNGCSTGIQLTSNQEPEPVTNKEPPPTGVGSAVGGEIAEKLAKAFGQYGIAADPADLKIIALAEQGIAPATVLAACHEAKQAKGDKPIRLNYALGILTRYAEEASSLRTTGATVSGLPAPPKPILPVEVQCPSLAGAKGVKPAGMGSLKSLIKHREQEVQ